MNNAVSLASLWRILFLSFVSALHSFGVNASTDYSELGIVVGEAEHLQSLDPKAVFWS